MSTHNLHIEPVHSESTHVHRIGSVSRLSGIPVSTLRMWESRHSAFSPGKTGGQHRLYTEADVVRARLLRQLTEAGHSIGGIAGLAAPHLQQMLTAARVAEPDASRRSAPASLSIAVVGAVLAARLQSPAWRRHLRGTLLDCRRVFMDLPEAEDAAQSAAGIDMLVARVNALQPATVQQLLRVKQATGAGHAVLLYNFGAHAGVATLRDAGFLVRREPIDDEELAELMRSTTWAQGRSGGDAETRPAAIPARRYDEVGLARVAASPSRMLCECPRHLVDILQQLSSFEEYSAQCLNESEEDANVHAQLRSVAGSARAMFEDALDLVLAHEDAKAR
jgi:MerR family transcriptional regulator, light-induced transcriptional regulator